jgi:hypothetical protein
MINTGRRAEKGLPEGYKGSNATKQAFGLVRREKSGSLWLVNEYGPKSPLFQP